MPAFCLSTESYQIENRLYKTLSTYLEPYEFLVIVNELTSNGNSLKGEELFLPGMPGVSSDESKVKFGGYFDLNDQLRGAKARPPVEVSIILHKSVSSETRRLLNRVVPDIAGLDTKYGDRFSVKLGNLESPSRKPIPLEEKPQRNWLDTFVQFKGELASLIFGILTAIGFIVLANSGLGIVRERSKKSILDTNANGSSFKEAGNANRDNPSIAFDSKPSLTAENKSEKTTTKESLSRDELYSKDSAFYQMVEEIRAQAEQHPHRMSLLIREWIQDGDVGIRNASILLRNFNFPVVEKIMMKMVASDLDCLKEHMSLEFDFFSKNNEHVILKARQDLMKIVASQTGKVPNESLEFLHSLEAEVLAELLRGENIKAFVIVGLVVPANRMSEVLRHQPMSIQEDYIAKIAELDSSLYLERDSIIKHLLSKMKSMDKIFMSENQRIDSLLQTLRNIKDEKQKIGLLKIIFEKNQHIYEIIRSKIVLFEDIVNLPERSMKILISDEDPVLVAHAFIYSDNVQYDRIRQLLPVTNQEIFAFEFGSKENITTDQNARACSHLVKKLEKLVYEQIVSTQDIRHNTINFEANRKVA